MTILKGPIEGTPEGSNPKTPLKDLATRAPKRDHCEGPRKYLTMKDPLKDPFEGPPKGARKGNLEGVSSHLNPICVLNLPWFARFPLGFALFCLCQFFHNVSHPHDITLFPESANGKTTLFPHQCQSIATCQCLPTFWQPWRPTLPRFLVGAPWLGGSA